MHTTVERTSRECLFTLQYTYTCDAVIVTFYLFQFDYVVRTEYILVLFHCFLRLSQKRAFIIIQLLFVMFGMLEML